MSSLSSKIKLYCEANSKTPNFGDGGNISIRNNSDGKGDFIASWSVSGLAEPTTNQLNSYEAQANKDEKNYEIRNTRRVAYGDIGDQLDLLYKDIVANKLDTTGEWAKKIKAVKDANAKE
jgi:hypothetical protein